MKCCVIYSISFVRGQTISTTTWQNLLWLVAISFVSPLCISELTRASEFTESLSGKTGVLLMADRGFTNSDQLAPYGIKFNISLLWSIDPKFQQKTSEKLAKLSLLEYMSNELSGGKRTSPHWKGTLPFSMSRTANQNVQVCHCLANFSQFLFLHHQVKLMHTLLT